MPPGWYPDNQNPTLVRFWDGRQWTPQTALARPPAPTVQPPPAATATRPGPWRSLRLRTKVFLVVGALVAFGALMPDEDQEPAENSQQAAQGNELQAAPDEVEVADAEEAVIGEDAVDETIEEEPVPITVPALRSQSIDQAKTALRTAGLKIEVLRQPSWQPVGEVLKQSSKAGAALAAGTVVTLVVAAPMPKVPGIVGQGAVAGQDALRRAGFKVRVVRKVVTSGPDNVVLGQSPTGEQSAAPGSVVELVVSNLVKPLAPVASNCTTGYEPCLAPAPDYDCAGGSGDGPMYATGPIYVSGSDPYDLDSEGDGVACE